MSQGRDLPQSFGEALQVAKEILSANRYLVRTNTVDTEAELIVIAAMEKSSGLPFSRLDLYSRLRDRFLGGAGQLVLMYAGARAEGRILQHLFGYQTFLEHRYDVTADVLVPRPETEILVQTAVEVLAKEPTPPVHGIEIGLGSGIISVELLSAIPALRMTASELSTAAAQIGLKNAVKILGPSAHERLRVLSAHTDREVIEPFVQAGVRRADFLISNPPYLAHSDEIESDVIQYEPAHALFAPEGSPLHFYAAIAQDSRPLLRPGALVFCEVPHERAQEIYPLFEKERWKVELKADLTGRSRVLIARA